MKTFHPFNALLIIAGIASLGSASIASGTETVLDSAENASESKVQLRGFGTLGIARSSSDQAEFVRDLSQPRGISNHWSGRIDSVLGAQANWQAAAEFELVGQVVSRYQYDASRRPEIMWAFAKWEPDSRLALRAGRLGADFLMAADSRLVGYSYLPVRPPTDYFGPLFFAYFDGADASITLPAVGGLLHAKAYGGHTREKASAAGQIWDTSKSDLSGLVVDYFTGPWQIRASAAQVRWSNDMPFEPLSSALRAAGSAMGTPTANAAANAIAVGGTTSQFTTVGAVYDDGPLQVQGMLNAIRHESGAFQNSRAGYLLAGYRLGNITPIVGISRWKSTAKNIATGLPDLGPSIALNQSLALVLRDSGSDQTTYTIGTRWDVQPNVALKAQWDAIRGTARSVFPYRGEQPGWTGRTDVLSLTIDFVF